MSYVVSYKKYCQARWRVHFIPNNQKFDLLVNNPHIVWYLLCERLFIFIQLVTEKVSPGSNVPNISDQHYLATSCDVWFPSTIFMRPLDYSPIPPCPHMA